MKKRNRIRTGESDFLRRAAKSKRVGPYVRFLNSLSDGARASLLQHLALAKQGPWGWQTEYCELVESCLSEWDVDALWNWLRRVHAICRSDQFWHVRQMDLRDTIWLAAEPIADPIRWVTGEVIGGPSEESVLVRWPMVPGTYVGNYPEALCSADSLCYTRPRVPCLKKLDMPND